MYSRNTANNERNIEKSDNPELCASHYNSPMKGIFLNDFEVTFYDNFGCFPNIITIGEAKSLNLYLVDSEKGESDLNKAFTGIQYDGEINTNSCADNVLLGYASMCHQHKCYIVREGNHVMLGIEHDDGLIEDLDNNGVIKGDYVIPLLSEIMDYGIAVLLSMLFPIEAMNSDFLFPLPPAGNPDFEPDDFDTGGGDGDSQNGLPSIFMPGTYDNSTDS